MANKPKPDIKKKADAGFFKKIGNFFGGTKKEPEAAVEQLNPMVKR